MSRAKNLPKTRAQGRKRPNSKALSAAGPLLTSRSLNAVLCILLASATIALYSPVIRYSFVVYDDQEYVGANAHIHGGLAWSTIKWAFTSTEESNWHPLTWLSHAFDYQLFALNPAGHHLDSVLIHGVNAVLLFLLLVWVTKRVGPSLLVAALFALHPLNVESVAWVAERKNVLSTFFFILAVGAYAWYARKPEWRRYLLVAALFALGLMAKPMVITLPFVLLLLDYWPLERMLNGTESGTPTSNGPPRLGFWRLLQEKLPLLSLSAASAWITLIAQRTAARTFEEFPLAIRIENALVAYGLYLWKMLWPARLALYPHSAIALPAWQWTLSTLVLLSVTAVVVAFRGKRYLPVGWFWFLGTLVPVIGLVQVGEASMADRYAYIPLIGIFIMIAWGLDDWAKVRKIRTVWRVLPALCALAALGYVTSRQMSYWESDYDLWLHTAAVAESPFAHNAVGGDLLAPDLAMTRHDLESFGTRQNRLDEARMHFERALELRRPLAQQNPGVHLPEMATTLTSLGTVDQLQNRTDEARGLYDEALKIRRQLAERNPEAYLPEVATTLMSLGTLDRHQNRLDEARQVYEEALKIRRQLAQQNPSVYLSDIAKTLISLGAIDLIQNRLDEGRRHYEVALEIDRQLAQQKPNDYIPEMATTLANLGTVEGRQNRIEESRAHFQEALSLLLKLSQGDKKYVGDVANVEASLQELEKKVNSR
jgi:tetratricopeptide (TPR) repeat protein